MNTTEIYENNSGTIKNDTLETSIEDFPEWAKVFELAYLVMIGLVGIPGNVLIILVQKNNKDKSSTDYLVVAMAFAELFCSAVNNTFRILSHTGRFWASIASDPLCQFHYYFMYVITVLSSYFLAAIAIDRCLKTCRPLNTFFNRRRTKGICVISLIVSLVLGAPACVTYELDENLVCEIAPEYLEFQLTWNSVGVTSSLQLVVGVFIVSYSIIAIELRKRVLIKRRNAAKATATSSAEITKSSVGSLKVRWLDKLRKKSKVTPVTESSTHTLNNTQTTGLGPTSTELNSECSNIEPSTNKLTEESVSDMSVKPSVMTISEPINTQASKGKRNTSLVEVTLTRTTRIMFVLSAIYAVLWTSVSITVHTDVDVFGVVMQRLAKTLFMINCITNPLVFFTMSSKYRAGAKKLLCKGQVTKK